MREGLAAFIIIHQKFNGELPAEVDRFLNFRKGDVFLLSADGMAQNPFHNQGYKKGGGMEEGGNGGVGGWLLWWKLGNVLPSIQQFLQPTPGP